MHFRVPPFLETPIFLPLATCLIKVAKDKVTTEFALPDGANARKERGDVQPTK